MSHPGLKTHITAKHTGNRKFGLQNKKNTIANNDDVESICEECDETFSTKSELKVHLNILHTIRSKYKPEESQDKDYSCEKCDKSFDEEHNIYKVCQAPATVTYALGGVIKTKS